MKHCFLCFLFGLLASSSSGLGAPRTSVSALTTTTTYQWLTKDSLTHTDTATKRDPRKATVRSLVFPGLGQLYNRQPWKLGLIYGGAGAAFYFFQTNQHLYATYMAGYEAAYLSVSTGTKTAIVDGRILSIQQLERAGDQFHQQRDLTLILTVVGWALNAVEANAAAHLMNFDLSDNLSIRITPSLLPTVVTGLAPGIRLTMNTRQ
jgi:hypothetical protein